MQQPTYTLRQHRHSGAAALLVMDTPHRVTNLGCRLASKPCTAPGARGLHGTPWLAGSHQSPLCSTGLAPCKTTIPGSCEECCIGRLLALNRRRWVLTHQSSAKGMHRSARTQPWHVLRVRLLNLSYRHRQVMGPARPQYPHTNCPWGSLTPDEQLAGRRRPKPPRVERNIPSVDTHSSPRSLLHAFTNTAGALAVCNLPPSCLNLSEHTYPWELPHARHGPHTWCATTVGSEPSSIHVTRTCQGAARGALSAEDDRGNGHHTPPPGTPVCIAQSIGSIPRPKQTPTSPLPRPPAHTNRSVSAQLTTVLPASLMRW